MTRTASNDNPYVNTPYITKLIRLTCKSALEVGGRDSYEDVEHFAYVVGYDVYHEALSNGASVGFKGEFIDSVADTIRDYWNATA